MLTAPGFGQEAAPTDDMGAIRAALDSQAQAWSHGDIDGYMQAYEDSPETTFVGRTVRKGYAATLERYRKGFPRRDAMGALRYSEVEIRLLPGAKGENEFATATGRFQLTRRLIGQPPSVQMGLFSLLWRKGPAGWKIVLDHTSELNAVRF